MRFNYKTQIVSEGVLAVMSVLGMMMMDSVDPLPWWPSSVFLLHHFPRPCLGQ